MLWLDGRDYKSGDNSSGRGDMIRNVYDLWEVISSVMAGLDKGPRFSVLRSMDCFASRINNIL